MAYFGKESTSSARDIGNSDLTLGWKYPLEEEMATHSSILAWRIQRTEEAGRLQSWGYEELDTNEVTAHARGVGTRVFVREGK